MVFPNRLKNVRDDDRNIVKNFKYNYGLGDPITASATTLFYNQITQGTFIKNNCSFGTPDTVVYVVPYGKYASVVNQTDANNKAQADVNANGQANSNAIGGCYFYNTQQTSFWIFRNNCPYEKGLGFKIRYIIPAGRYKSAISQNTVDSMALADITANGQSYANANGICTCDAPNLRYISDECVTGVRVNDGGYQQSNGQWICFYFYTFNGVRYSTEDFYETSSYPCLQND